jgi:hypothetical protein
MLMIQQEIPMLGTGSVCQGCKKDLNAMDLTWSMSFRAISVVRGIPRIAIIDPADYTRVMK